MTTGDFSIAVWVKTSVNGETFAVGKHKSGSAPGYFIGLNMSGTLGSPNKAYFYNNSATAAVPVSTTSVNDGAWHQIVAVYHAGGNAEIYVDGGPAEGTPQLSHTMAEAAADFMVGGITYGESPTSKYTGWVDELQVFDHALTQCEVEFLHSNPGATLPEPGVIGQWHFDEDPVETVAADSAGAHAGALNGDAVFAPGGISGNAVEMSGSGYVTMGDAFPMNHCGDFSVAAWVKTTDAGESFVVGRHLAGGSPGHFIGLNVSSHLGALDKAYFYNNNGGTSDEPVSSTNVNDDAWHQIVAVYHAGGPAEIYVDEGPAEGTPQTSHAMAKAVAHFMVGGITVGSTPTAYFTGMVDELRVFGHALSQDEVEFWFANPGVELVFADGFEDGDTTTWSSSVGE
jgi:hypothetical protein